MPAPAPINRIPSAPPFLCYSHFDSLFFSLRGVCVRARVCFLVLLLFSRVAFFLRSAVLPFFPSFILSLRLFLPPLRTKDVLLGGDLPSSLFYHFSPRGRVALSLCVRRPAAAATAPAAAAAAAEAGGGGGARRGGSGPDPAASAAAAPAPAAAAAQAARREQRAASIRRKRAAAAGASGRAPGRPGQAAAAWPSARTTPLGADADHFHADSPGPSSAPATRRPPASAPACLALWARPDHASALRVLPISMAFLNG